MTFGGAGIEYTVYHGAVLPGHPVFSLPTETLFTVQTELNRGKLVNATVVCNLCYVGRKLVSRRLKCLRPMRHHLCE